MNFTDDSIVELESLDINITPLIDIVFLLLIFFMLTTTFVESRGLQVKLPKASTASSSSTAKNIVISVNKNNLIYINDTPVTMNKLSTEIRNLLKSSKDPLLVLRADADTKHGETVTIMDIAKQAGINRIAIATAPVAKQSTVAVK